MFPTSGFFKGTPCPYYASGLCERPYCHFKHVKVEENVPVDIARGKHYVPVKTKPVHKPAVPLGGAQYKPTPISLLQKSEDEQGSSSFTSKRKVDGTLTKAPRSQAPYIPTPIKDPKWCTPGKSRYQRPTVAYIPTPIKQLDLPNQLPTYSPVVAQSPENADTEYDPAPVYSPSKVRSDDVEMEEPHEKALKRTSDIIDIGDSDDEDMEDTDNLVVNMFSEKEVNSADNSLEQPSTSKSKVKDKHVVEGNSADKNAKQPSTSKRTTEVKDIDSEEEIASSVVIAMDKVTRRRVHSGEMDSEHQSKKHKKKLKKKTRDKDTVEKKLKAREVEEDNVVDKNAILRDLYFEVFGEEEEVSSCPTTSSNSSSRKVSSKNVSSTSHQPAMKTNSSSDLPERLYDPLRGKWYVNGVVENSESKSRVVASKKKLRPPQEVMYNRIRDAQTNKVSLASSNKVSSSNQTSSRPPPPKSAPIKTARPVLPATCGTKIAVSIRQKYLNQFIEECLKIYDLDTDAYSRALNEEQQAYDKSPSRMIYLNAVISSVKRLRQEQGAKAALEIQGRNTVSHGAILDGPNSANCSVIQPSLMTAAQLNDTVTGRALYGLLKKFVLTEEELVSNGYPRPHPDQKLDHAVLPKAAEIRAQYACSGNHRICVRCGTKFPVNEEGEILKQVECVYHWGKAWRQRIAGQGIEHRYNCCSSDLSQKGCQLSSSHVHDTNRWMDSLGFLRTLPPPPCSDPEDLGVYALDCEMVYTTAGCELARVTVIDRRLEVVYEALVVPNYPVVDYNTRFSGLTADNFKGVNTRLVDVQEALFRLVNEETILMGHSLESDLIALKLIHSKVVDTSLVFPHRLGPPKKRALRNIVGDVLQRIIQADLGGHDSKEDAVVCMELMQYRVKEDLRKQNRDSSHRR